ncbi:single-stranded DNA-binding protein 3-like [Gadus macrocephalus]|uniref:single-stranded DNA-binding protein 3-like n=1 Tax=Gadus macrocephalus TaxID=80720 RepID=UPI0028CB527F|nr:single-stranded DNA-binding protein 3-like [Gadus macrocephalus]
MYAKGKGAVVPSDSQAREKLALYVYEYLLHVGAQKSAQTFLSEIRWEKNITLGEPPGFLHSWWWYVRTHPALVTFNYSVPCCFSADSTNSSENIYTMMNPIGPGGNRPNFPMGPGPDGPMGGMGSMEQHHMNGSLGSGDMDGLPKVSPNNMAGMNNPPGTPRDDGEMAGNFLNPFQSESYSPNMTMSV